MKIRIKRAETEYLRPEDIAQTIETERIFTKQTRKPWSPPEGMTEEEKAAALYWYNLRMDRVIISRFQDGGTCELLIDDNGEEVLTLPLSEQERRDRGMELFRHDRGPWAAPIHEDWFGELVRDELSVCVGSLLLSYRRDPNYGYKYPGDFYAMGDTHVRQWCSLLFETGSFTKPHVGTKEWYLVTAHLPVKGGSQ